MDSWSVGILALELFTGKSAFSQFQSRAKVIAPPLLRVNVLVRCNNAQSEPALAKAFVSCQACRGSGAPSPCIFCVSHA